MAEFELSGSAVQQWMMKVDPATATQLLVGCGVDDGEADDLLDIESIAANNVLICRFGGRLTRIPAAKLKTCSVYVDRTDHPLRAAVEASRTPTQRRLDELRQELQSLRVPTSSITNERDAETVLAAWQDDAAGVLPSEMERNQRYETFKRLQLLRSSAHIIDGWRKASLRTNEPLDAGILIQLAFCLRYNGDLANALEATNVLELQAPFIRIRSGQRAILATMRAAILMDLYEAEGDTDRLGQAKQYAAKAWSIAQSPETRMVYNRLNKLKGEAEKTEAEAQRWRAMRRVGTPQVPADGLPLDMTRPRSLCPNKSP
jgi:hypothetical protein